MTDSPLPPPLYACGVELCRWAAFNGPHPDMLHAVWWGCTPRPARPFEPGELVSHVTEPTGAQYPVERCEWDSGTGWHVVVRYRDDQWGTVREDPDRLVRRGAIQPELFDPEVTP